MVKKSCVTENTPFYLFYINKSVPAVVLDNRLTVDVQNLKQVQNYSDDELISMVNLHNAVNGKQKLDKRVRQNWISVLRVLSFC